MDTQKIAAQFRLSGWGEAVKERHARGQTISAFCKERGISKNTYDMNNRLTQKKKTVNGIDNVSDFWYDKNGNMLTERGYTLKNTGSAATAGVDALGQIKPDMTMKSYSYDNFNRLTGYTDLAGVSASYAYNANGLRSSKTVNGATTNHIWDGMHIVAETNGSNAITARYYRGRGLIASNINNAMNYYVFNGHGDTVALVNSAGTKVADYSYDSFGNQQSATGNVHNPFRFNSGNGYFDNESGLIYNIFRYYDSSSGRWISEDPIKMASGTLNWYSFCSNDPVNKIDPLGLKEKGERLGLGSGGFSVEALQRTLNYLGFRDDNGNKLVVDGDFGTSTMQAVNKYKIANYFLFLVQLEFKRLLYLIYY